MALVLVLAVLLLMAVGAVETFAPLSAIASRPISLDPTRLPGYAVRTVLRMLAAMTASLLFTVTYGTAAAKSVRAGIVLVPLLDILQSVPILGYLSFTGCFSCRCSQAGCLEPSLLRSLPYSPARPGTWHLVSIRPCAPCPETSMRSAAPSSSPRGSDSGVWTSHSPYPGLVWNMMMSMSGGWFFVVAAEAISVGNQQIMLPGIGSYVSLAIQQEKLSAIGWAILAMTIVILAYDQLLFRPLVVWADNFRIGQTAAQTVPRSWFLQVLRHSRFDARRRSARRTLRTPARQSATAQPRDS